MRDERDITTSNEDAALNITILTNISTLLVAHDLFFPKCYLIRFTNVSLIALTKQELNCIVHYD